MEGVYCCNCAEIIWNYLPFEKILLQIKEHVHTNYSDAVFQQWSSRMRTFLQGKNDRFGSISFCPHCTVNYSKAILESITRQKDDVLEKFLLAFEGI